MNKQWKQYLYIAAVLCVSASCMFQDRTTVVFGTVKDDVGKPIKGVDIEFYGEKGILGSRQTLLRTISTDIKGEYTITIEMPKEFHSGDIIWRLDATAQGLYTLDSRLFFNGNETKDCCGVSVGEKNQYDRIYFKK